MTRDAAGHIGTGEAANALGVDRSTLSRWAAAGHVQPARATVGGYLRWDLDALQRQVQALTSREVLPMPDTRPDEPERQPVAAAIITSALGVLVGQRHDGKPPWTFIAGEIEPGESPEDAAVREVKEESGLLVTVDRVIGRRVHPRTGRTMVYVAASSPTGATDVFVGDPDELAAVEWATWSQVVERMGEANVYDPVADYLRATIPH